MSPLAIFLVYLLLLSGKFEITQSFSATELNLILQTT